MEEPDLLARVRDLERDVAALKLPPGRAARATGFAALCKRLPRLLIENWVLFSFVAAVLVAAYVKVVFNLGPLESYHSAATSRTLADFYTKMGDKMMGRAEWKAAERDYRDALQMSPHNAEAASGLVKAQVFQPLPGEKSCAGDVMDARLRELDDLFPNDYQIDFLKSFRFHAIGEDLDATRSLRRCLERNPNFAGCYAQLAYIEVGQGKMAEAETNLVEALRRDPDFANYMGNLASIYLHFERYSEAAALLERSYRISPHAVSAFSLGQVYWYLGRFDDALQRHQEAVDNLAQDQDGRDRYEGSEWISAYLPLHPKDLDTIKISVRVTTLEQKVTLLHFELAIDHALLGQVDDAEREFALALKSQPPKKHLQLIQNRMQSIINMVSMSDAAKQWLGEHQQRLSY